MIKKNEKDVVGDGADDVVVGEQDAPVSSSYNIVKIDIYDLWKELRHHWSALHACAQDGKVNTGSWKVSMRAARKHLMDMYASINNMSNSWDLLEKSLSEDRNADVGVKLYENFHHKMGLLWKGTSNKKGGYAYYYLTFEDLNDIMEVLSMWMVVSGMNELEYKFRDKGGVREEPIQWG